MHPQPTLRMSVTVVWRCRSMSWLVGQTQDCASSIHLMASVVYPEIVEMLFSNLGSQMVILVPMAIAGLYLASACSEVAFQSPSDWHRCCACQQTSWCIALQLVGPKCFGPGCETGLRPVLQLACLHEFFRPCKSQVSIRQIRQMHIVRIPRRTKHRS